jgi:type IV secretion system protein VirB9
MRADQMVIHRIARRFILRRGRLSGCIVNKGFAGSGRRLPSGTISPRVWRVTRVRGRNVLGYGGAR